MKTLFVWCILMHTMLCQSDPQAVHYRAEYAVYHKSKQVGKAVFDIDHSSPQTIEFSARGEAKLWWFNKQRYEETSRFTIQDGVVKPIQINYQINHQSSIQQEMDWPKQERTLTWNGQTVRQTTVQPVFGTLNHLLALRQDVLTHRGDKVYTIIDELQTKPYSYQYDGEEQLQTILGPQNTTRWKRVRSDRVFTIWLAKDLDAIPLRFHYKNRFVELDARITHYEKQIR